VTSIANIGALLCQPQQRPIATGYDCGTPLFLDRGKGQIEVEKGEGVQAGALALDVVVQEGRSPGQCELGQ
jgi:hypothetical protein